MCVKVNIKAFVKAGFIGGMLYADLVLPDKLSLLGTPR